MTTLVGHEIVVHVFIGTAANDWNQLGRLWERCRQSLSLDAVAGPWPQDLPDSRSGANGMVAACSRSGPGVHQAALRREDGALVLSLLLNPAQADPRSWDELTAEWYQLLPPAASWPLGSACLLLARTTDPLDPQVLEAAVALDLPTGVDLRGPGVLAEVPPLNPFAVWEGSCESASDELRSHRRLIVVAADGRERELSGWTWRGREPTTPPPLGRYLATAASLRRILQTRSRSITAASLRQADDVMEPVRNLVDATAIGNEPTTEELLDALRPLYVLQAGTVDIAGRASRLRDAQRSVLIARRNLAALAPVDPNDTDAGPFADDRRLAERSEHQYDHDATYLEAAAERARDVVVVADQLLQRGLARRQEQVNQLLTGTVGAILMGLAAIQAFGWKVPLPEYVQAPVIAVLTAVAFLAPLVLVRLVGPRRRLGSDIGVGTGSGVLAGSVAWLVVMATDSGPPVWALAFGAMSALVVTLLLHRAHHR